MAGARDVGWAMADLPPNGTQAPPTLEYQRPAEIVPMARGWAVCFVFTSALTAVCPFVAFTGGGFVPVSPLDAIRALVADLTNGWFSSNDELYLLGLPFFLGLVIACWKIRLTVSLRTFAWERTILWSLAVLSLCATAPAALQLAGSLGDWDPQVIASLASPALVATSGLAFIIWLQRRGQGAPILITTALYTAYIVNAAFCLVVFANDREPGWWLTLVALPGLAFEVGVYLVYSVRRRA